MPVEVARVSVEGEHFRIAAANVPLLTIRHSGSDRALEHIAAPSPGGSSVHPEHRVELEPGDVVYLGSGGKTVFETPQYPYGLHGTLLVKTGISVTDVSGGNATLVEGAHLSENEYPKGTPVILKWGPLALGSNPSHSVGYQHKANGALEFTVVMMGHGDRDLVSSSLPSERLEVPFVEPNRTRVFAGSGVLPNIFIQEIPYEYPYQGVGENFYSGKGLFQVEITPTREIDKLNYRVEIAFYAKTDLDSGRVRKFSLHKIPLIHKPDSRNYRIFLDRLARACLLIEDVDFYRQLLEKKVIPVPLIMHITKAALNMGTQGIDYTIESNRFRTMGFDIERLLGKYSSHERGQVRSRLSVFIENQLGVSPAKSIRR